MRISTIKTADKQVMQVYAARDYDYKNPRLTQYVEINIPEYTPTIPRDNKYETIVLSANYCVNRNFPRTDSTVRITHYIKLPLLRGSTCPTYFKKNTPFLLLCPTGRIEEGYLMYI